MAATRAKADAKIAAIGHTVEVEAAAAMQRRGVGLVATEFDDSEDSGDEGANGGAADEPKSGKMEKGRSMRPADREKAQMMAMTANGSADPAPASRSPVPVSRPPSRPPSRSPSRPPVVLYLPLISCQSLVSRLPIVTASRASCPPPSANGNQRKPLKIIGK